MLLSAGVRLVPSVGTAEITLDEFNDSARAVVQRCCINPFVETENVAALHAKRQLRFATAGTEPVGSLDINATSPGRMAIQIQELKKTISTQPLTAVQFNYFFSPTDVTEGGKNNAILLDFVELLGERQPSFLRALVVDDTHVGSFVIEHSPVFANDSPHTVAMPFNSFTLRNGGLGLPDATKLKSIYFDFYFIGHEGELNWQARIERIRFGSVAVVPEPEPTALMWAGVLSFGWSRFCWKGVSSNVVPATQSTFPVSGHDSVRGEFGRLRPANATGGVER